MNNHDLCLPGNYRRRTEEVYFSDLGNRDEWQDDVYEYAASFRPGSVADVGCGSAFKLLKHFRHLGSAVVGIDVEPTVSRLRNRYPERTWYSSDSLPDCRFDLVIAADVIEHVADPRAFLQLCLRLCAPGGHVVLSTPDRTARTAALPEDVACPLGPPRNGAHLQEWGWREFEMLCGRYGAVRDHRSGLRLGQMLVLVPRMTANDVVSLCTTAMNRSKVPGLDGQERNLLKASIDSWIRAAETWGGPFEIVVIDWNSTDTDYGWLHDCTRLRHVSGPFSLGVGRNSAIASAAGDLLFVLDADMLVPDNFVADTLPAVRDGVAVFPGYVRETSAGLVPGAGWGNVCLNRAAYNRTGGWNDSTTWGGEDTKFHHALRRAGVPWERREKPALIHQYHAKAGNGWYGKGL